MYHKEEIVKCYYCGGKHITRECALEVSMAPILKRKVGFAMEYYVSECIACPECNNMTLKVIGDNTPSLDMVCESCNNKFEVKSKCLSAKKIPNDLTLPHGLYLDYTRRKEEGLNIIFIIYGVDRKSKTVTVREALYASNFDLYNQYNVNVEPKVDSKLSTIIINNKKRLIKLELHFFTSMAFDGIVDHYC